MVKTAEEYNCEGFLMKASLRVEDLSSAFCQMSTLITDTKTTMTDFKTNSQRTFRDLIREPKSAIRVYIEDEALWKVYTNLPSSSANVVRAFFDKDKYLWTYPERTFESYSAVGIAVRDYIFGEGKERAVRRVREVNSRGQFVGTPLVGKETLFQEDLDPHDVRAFHKNFCKLQQLAKKYARYFNRNLTSLPGIDRSKMPTIQFLDCWVMLFSKENNERGAILVEKMLDHEKYMKWNTNGGYVRTGNTYPGAAMSFSGQNGDYHFLLEDIRNWDFTRKAFPILSPELVSTAVKFVTGGWQEIGTLLGRPFQSCLQSSLAQQSSWTLGSGPPPPGGVVEAHVAYLAAVCKLLLGASSYISRQSSLTRPALPGCHCRRTLCRRCSVKTSYAITYHAR
eukprot:scaffold1918_cov100-Skeletonema_marinoi.AAC.1